MILMLLPLIDATVGCCSCCLLLLLFATAPAAELAAVGTHALLLLC